MNQTDQPTKQLKKQPRVFVALGSNLQQPAKQVALALDHLAEHPNLDCVAQSGLYQTPPWGNTDQPAFVNAVAELATTMAPAALLETLLGLEQFSGRVRTTHWGPRVIDLDLLAYGQCVFRTPGLTLPHPGIAERAFVLVPWAEIAPDFALPGLGRVHELLAKCAGAEAVIGLADA